MNKSHKHITIFEHQSLWVDKGVSKLSYSQLTALQAFHEKNGDTYFNLIYKGVKFKEYVGVLQVGDLTIEVLPKADKYTDESKWRDILIGMLRAVGIFNIHAPSTSSLKLKTNSILDLYFELFIKEVEYLLNKGLIKKYRKTESNQLALKGSIKFSTHIQKNFIHKERFYTKHTTYDKEHLLHQILFKTIKLLSEINTNLILKSRINSLLLNFPEMVDFKVNESTFNKIILNRKTEDYKMAIDISKLLLLNYHPNVSKGHNNILAIMFDMNMLWEQFIFVSLRKYKNSETTIKAQTSKYFWKPRKGYQSKMRADIVISNGKENTVVLDTKWKNIGHKNPTSDDLRQLYVYHEYYNAKKVALIYPGSGEINKGNYFKTDNETLSDKECSVITIPTNETIAIWQKEIAKHIFKDWLNVDDK